MKFAIIISIILFAGAIAYIAYLFQRDHKIQSQGRDVQARVEEVRYLSANDNGTTNIKYRLSWHENGVTKQVEGKETIPAFYSSKVQKGCEVDIKYLDDDHIQFVFDK
ncbi:hypothetical protein V2T44_05225 [Serratia ficaria]|uniref:DUF3592 domain-containing protein n=1 Tax=Serratia ficaria TaxID=61651 RepID=A0A240B0H5_SERFI|nr:MULTISPECIES: hypothetical protein [Serratia]MEE4482366.1 hypothetical protein [Serratia ficaria]REF46299.1 hypothetical protein C7332_4688 [Serratia ficaria]CAI0924576.1 Uncharacterised protein [Serratia ficaria]CAI0989127.1 Uncharacterised protein [Serratia ficaria]CAI0992609.1 Uncharacterised protein [Serratia ficaria]